MKQKSETPWAANGSELPKPALEAEIKANLDVAFIAAMLCRDDVKAQEYKSDFIQQAIDETLAAQEVELKNKFHKVYAFDEEIACALVSELMFNLTHIIHRNALRLMYASGIDEKAVKRMNADVLKQLKENHDLAIQDAASEDGKSDEAV